MYRHVYDSDVTVFTPQGRLLQIEYAMQAVKLGSATVALKNKEYVVLVALKRTASEKKIIKIDDHIGVSVSGFTADAPGLSRWLRSECLTYKYLFHDRQPLSRLMYDLGNKMQITTQRYDRRPYGIGLLIAGCDDKGPHIYHVAPSANYLKCKAMAIGSRSEGCKTYLEQNLKKYRKCSKDDLICYGIKAIRESLQADDSEPKDPKLSLSNICVAIVGKDTPFTFLSDEQNTYYIKMATMETEAKGPATSSGGPHTSGTAMEH